LRTRCRVPSTDLGPVDFLDGGWVQFVNPLPGWEAFSVDVRADLVNGEPRITGVRVEPREGARRVDAVLTSSRLRRLPIAALAPAVYHLTHLRPDTLPDAIDALDGAAQAVAAAGRRKGRRATTAQDVATVYASARLHGKPPRAAVCEALNVSSRTADRYISQARRAGLLAPYVEEEQS